jgi:ABC-type nitrate/sulfonate/bicarbonate transport system substrate-binding protein
MTTMRDRRDFLKVTFGSVLAVGASGFLAACGGDDDDDASASDTTSGSTSTTAPKELMKLSVMMPFAPGFNFIADTAAQAGGFFTDNGLDVDLQFAQSAPLALQQLAAGAVSVIRNAPIAVVRSVSQEGAPFVAIGMPNQEVLYRLVSTPDEPVDDLQSLEGKTVGMATLGGNAEDTFVLVLRGAGINPDTVTRVAVGNDAAALAFVEDGRVDALWATLESTATMQALGQDPHLADLDDLNPLLGTAIVTTTQKLEEERDAIVAYLRSVDQSMRAVMDEEQLDELLPKVVAEFDIPGEDDPEAAKPVIEAITTLWTAAGEENLLRNVPERWEEGVAEFEELKIAKAGSDPTSFYTNDLLDEATA